MNIEIQYNPSYALAVVSLGAGEQIKAEGGSMVSMSSSIGIQTGQASGAGILKSLKSAFLGGTSFWMNTFTAQGGKGRLPLPPLSRVM